MAPLPFLWSVDVSGRIEVNVGYTLNGANLRKKTTTPSGDPPVAPTTVHFCGYVEGGDWCAFVAPMYAGVRLGRSPVITIMLNSGDRS